MSQTIDPAPQRGVRPSPGVILALAFWLAASLIANSAPAATTAKHSLWRVQGRTNRVYLLGAIHVLKRENYPLPPIFEAAFSNAAIAVFETDLEALEKPEAQQQLLSQGRLPEGQSLRQVLPPDLYSNFTRQVSDAGFPVEAFETLKPAMAAMTVEVLELQKLGYDFEYGLDRHFFQLARRDGKTIVPLESVEFQINLITEMPANEGEQLLKATLEDIDQTRKLAGDMLKAWQTGDAAGLQKLLNYGMRDAPDLYRRMLTDRNRRWLPRIEALLHGDKPAIIIVGAGHLVGPDGLVTLLKGRGLRVIQE